MASYPYAYALHGLVPATLAFSLLGWTPWGSSSYPPPIESADYTSKSSAKAPVPEARLKDVQVIFRHGARTPLASSDAYWKGTSWNVCGERYEALIKSLRKGSEKKLPILSPLVVDKSSKQPKEECIDQALATEGVYPGGCSKGELTKLGQEQALALGVWLRRRYSGTDTPVATAYSSENVLAHSTNYRRTRATLHGVLLGLFPGASEAFRVTTNEFADDLLLGQMPTCANFSAWFKANRQKLKDADEVDEEVLAVESHMHAILGLEEGAKRMHFGELHDSLTCMRAHGKPINSKLTAADLDLINRLATERIVKMFTDPNDPAVASMLMGRLITVMHDRMHAAAESAADSPVKISLWSGHDTTLMPVLIMLGQSVTRWPPYASSLVMELWEDMSPAAQVLPPAQRHYVRALFNGQEVAVPPATSVAGELLTLERFHELVVSRRGLTEDERAARCAAVSKWWGVLNEMGLGQVIPAKEKVDSSKY